MSLFPSNDTAQFLASLETRLQQDPVEGDQGLTEIPKTLNELIERDQLDICESAVKILGDALGKQSMDAFSTTFRFTIDQTQELGNMSFKYPECLRLCWNGSMP